jgi:hypothetical protein
MPSIKGTVFRKPKVVPDEARSKLAGPGLTVRGNIARKKGTINSNVIRVNL